VPNDNVTFATYTEHDKAAVLAVLRSNTPEFFAEREEEDLVATLDDPDGPHWVLRTSDEVVGYGGFEIGNMYNRVVLTWGMVHRKMHRQGLGRFLLAHRAREARSGNGREYALAGRRHHTTRCAILREVRLRSSRSLGGWLPSRLRHGRPSNAVRLGSDGSAYRALLVVGVLVGRACVRGGFVPRWRCRPTPHAARRAESVAFFIVGVCQPSARSRAPFRARLMHSVRHHANSCTSICCCFRVRSLGM